MRKISQSVFALFIVNDEGGQVERHLPLSGQRADQWNYQVLEIRNNLNTTFTIFMATKTHKIV